MNLIRENYLELPISKLGKEFKIAPDFSLHEIQSKDGADIVRVHPYSPIMLQAIRAEYGKSVIINSGYRTPEHNKDIGGAMKSTHLFGMGYDIRGSEQSDLDDLYKAVLRVKRGGKVWVGGLKRYGTFVHVDCWIDRAW